MDSKILFLIIGQFLFFTKTNGQGDSTNLYSLRWQSIVLPCAMVSYGVIGLENENIKAFNQEVRKSLKYTKSNTEIDDYFVHLNLVAVYGLDMMGYKGKHDLKRKTILLASSHLITQIPLQTLKYTTKVLRPDASTRNSFPSSHTAVAFIGAECLYQEYKHRSKIIPIIGYLVASGIGYMRIYNDRHWFTDVVTGAGMGILGTKIAYHLEPKIFNRK
jgi:hypothetical protein